MSKKAVLPSTKKCTRCPQVLPRTNEFFQKLSSTSDGLDTMCKKCRSSYQRAYRERFFQRHPDKKIDWAFAGQLARYGLTVDQYDAMLVEQGGRCAICREEPVATNKHNSRLHVDHDHQTGAVRGLLCSECNVGIGKLHDDPELLLAAALYLRKDCG